MPIMDLGELTDFEESFRNIFESNPAERPETLRKMFVEKLDFVPSIGIIALDLGSNDSSLPEQAELLATMSGVSVVFVSFDEGQKMNQIYTANVLNEVSKAVGDTLLVAVNPGFSQLHFIYPTFETGKQILRRLIVERDLPRRTAVQQISKIYSSFNQTNDIRGALDRAYDVKAVDEEFFQSYKRAFIGLMEKLEGFGQGEEEEEIKKNFAQTLLNRMMFVYFLSKKGWLTFNGNNDYLNALWDDYSKHASEENFYRSRLEPLFFEGLNNQYAADSDTRVDAITDVIGNVPFINGGLFDKSEGESRWQLEVPDEAILEITQQVFDRFNFTVSESTPLDVEVAVDPEMLGQVFERLVTERHERGAYYTPRNVVSFMVRESIKSYLHTGIPELDDENLRRFVDDKDVSGLDIGTAARIGVALEDITVLDPACGSGAYLVGALHELVNLETSLYSERLLNSHESLYDLKLRIISRNLYGVDLEQFAVNIAMLRLWLSLAVEYEGSDPQPLPNLDFKIGHGDSLTGPATQNFGDLFNNALNNELVKRITELQNEYLSAVGKDKLLLSAKIEEMRQEFGKTMADSKSLENAGFDWRLQYPEVMSAGGFDVVLANPPFIRQEIIKGQFGDNYKSLLGSIYPEAFGNKCDLSVAFYARAHQLLKGSGTACFISSNKWLRATYGEKLRQHILDANVVHSVIDFGELPVFDAATDPAIIHWQKRKRGHSATRWAVIKDLDACYAEGIWNYVNEISENVPAVQFGKGKARLASTKSASRRLTMEASGPLLGDMFGTSIHNGIKTGFNEPFQINRTIREHLISQDPKNEEVIKPLIAGEDVRSYEVHFRETYLIFFQRGMDIDEYPAVRDHLMGWRKKLEARQSSNPTAGGSARAYEWFQTQATVTYYDDFEKTKIIYPETGQTMRFAMDTSGFYTLNATFFISSDDLYLLGVLNSSTALEYMKGTASSHGDPEEGGRLRFFTPFMKKLPIPNASYQDRMLVESLTQEILLLHQTRRDQVEKFLQINGTPPSGLSSRSSLEKPWELSMGSLPPRGVNFECRELWVDVSESTKELTEQIIRRQTSIDELISNLYGLGSN